MATRTAGSRVRAAKATATTERIIPRAIVRKTMTGTRNTADSDEHDGERGQEDGLARGGHGVLDRLDGVLALDPLLPVAADDEEAVVDADGEADHHREVHRPHRHRRDPRRACGAAAKPTAMPASASRSGMPAAISAPKAMTSMITVGRPLTSSALWRASSFIGVEVAPHRPFTGDLRPGRAGRDARGADVVTELSGRHGTVGVLADLLLDRDEGRACRPGRSSRASGGRGGVDDREDLRSVLELGHHGGRARAGPGRSVCPGGRRRSGSPRRARGTPAQLGRAPSRPWSRWRPSRHRTGRR